MITVEKREQIRRAYLIEHKSIRQIAKELNCGRHTIREAIESAEAKAYTLSEPRPAPILGAHKARAVKYTARYPAGRERPPACQTALHQRDDLQDHL